MQRTGMTLEDVVEVYSGFEGRLWELIMGEQIHIGGYASSKALGDLAGWRPGQRHFDAMQIIGCNREIFEYMGGEFAFMLEKAREGVFGRGRFVGILAEQ